MSPLYGGIVNQSTERFHTRGREARVLTFLLHIEKYIRKRFIQLPLLEHSLGADDSLACKPRNQLSQLAAVSEHLQRVLG